MIRDASMDSSKQDISELYWRAIKLDDKSQRGAFLDEVCGADHKLRAELERLTEATSEVENFLERPLEFESTELFTSVEQKGDWVGSYRPLERLGEGGMGVVYLAEQRTPIRRRVALKIIKPGMDSEQVLARFENERHALAMMDHPNIARALDAGTTETARPYFVMELVEGPPITQYCDEQRFTVPQRLNLFRDVCLAVQHAHQKGIIHRDIKPSNVLVAEVDGKPIVKVIDFGVAKAVSQKLTDETFHTTLQQVVGTPMYMSPEQASRQGLDIDTRSDIYSLGVMLFELITGCTPFEKESLLKAELEEVRRIIREQEPPKPSSSVTLLSTRRKEIGFNRSTDTIKLAASLKGEIDWIVMRAMEKEPGRRYQHVSGLAEDIDSVLRDEPVKARPPSASYQLQKFVRRNRSLVAASFAVAVALLLGFVGTMVGFINASKQAAEAKAANSQLLRNLENSALTTQNIQRSLLNQTLDAAIRGDAERTLHYQEIIARVEGNYRQQMPSENRIDEPGDRLSEMLMALVNEVNAANEKDLGRLRNAVDELEFVISGVRMQDSFRAAVLLHAVSDLILLSRDSDEPTQLYESKAAQLAAELEPDFDSFEHGVVLALYYSRIRDDQTTAERAWDQAMRFENATDYWKSRHHRFLEGGQGQP